MYYGHLAGIAYPIIIGHEFCGTIEKLGAGVTEDSRGNPVKEGDRVIVIPGVSCGYCYYCAIAKTPTRCSNIVAYGFMPDDDKNVLAGGYAQYVYVQYPHTPFLKTDLPANIAVLTEPLTMVIQGAGAIGLGALLFARYGGAAKTIVIGGPPSRLELAKQFGADVVIDIAEVKDPEERIRLVKEETMGKRGADIVFECAGIPATIPEGLSMLRDSGRYVELGHFTNVGPIGINPHLQLMQKNADLFACWGGEIEFFIQGLPFLEKREYPYEKIVDPVIPMGRAKEAVEAIVKRGWKMDGRDIFKVAIDPWL
jgi:threonine dehydrogenase-like Zn-dependent dehydrogenase